MAAVGGAGAARAAAASSSASGEGNEEDDLGLKEDYQEMSKRQAAAEVERKRRAEARSAEQQRLKEAEAIRKEEAAEMEKAKKAAKMKRAAQRQEERQRKSAAAEEAAREEEAQIELAEAELADHDHERDQLQQKQEAKGGAEEAPEKPAATKSVLVLDGMQRAFGRDKVIETLASVCARGEVPDGIRCTRMPQGGIFLMAPTAFIDACADEMHLAALRGKLGERLLIRRPVRKAAKRQELVRACASRVKFSNRSLSKRDVTADAVIRALTRAQVSAETFHSVTVFSARPSRMGFIQMASPELASKLIATGSLDTNLNGISVKLKLTPFEPDPPKRQAPAAAPAPAQPAAREPKDSDASGSEYEDQEEKFQPVLGRNARRSLARARKREQERQQLEQPQPTNKGAPASAKGQGANSAKEPEKDVQLIAIAERLEALTELVAELSGARAGQAIKSAEAPKKHLSDKRDEPFRVLNAKITALTRQAAQANREIKRLTDENRRLGEELTKIKRFPAVPPEAAEEMRELQRKNANLQSSVADLDDQRQQLAEACDALEKRNEELSNELNKRPATTGARGRKPPVGAATSDAGSRRTRSRSVTQQQQQAERTQLEETQHEEDDAGVVETQRHGGADSL